MGVCPVPLSLRSHLLVTTSWDPWVYWFYGKLGFLGYSGSLPLCILRLCSSLPFCSISVSCICMVIYDQVSLLLTESLWGSPWTANLAVSARSRLNFRYLWRSRKTLSESRPSLQYSVLRRGVGGLRVIFDPCVLRPFASLGHCPISLEPRNLNFGDCPQINGVQP